jgi:hypothetical protein
MKRDLNLEGERLVAESEKERLRKVRDLRRAPSKRRRKRLKQLREKEWEKVRRGGAQFERLMVNGWRMVQPLMDSEEEGEVTEGSRRVQYLGIKEERLALKSVSLGRENVQHMGLYEREGKERKSEAGNERREKAKQLRVRERMKENKLRERKKRETFPFWTVFKWFEWSSFPLSYIRHLV